MTASASFRQASSWYSLVASWGGPAIEVDAMSSHPSRRIATGVPASIRNGSNAFVKSYGMCVCDIHLSPLVYSYRAGQVQNITSPGSPDSGAPEAFPTPAVVGVIGADSCKIIEISHGGNTVGVDQIHEPL